MQTIAIILHFREADAARFEALFEERILPLWREFVAAGSFRRASLTPVLGGAPPRPSVRSYILHVEATGMEGHEAFDHDARFERFLEQVRPWQPHEPEVWFGDTRFEVG
ncbi:MAG: hypothetical protein LC624_11755 [Halobacteriales archaeon]|nr:hypothetical protein [Halobacteriales archaeon]